MFGTLLFWYLGFSVFWYFGSSTPYVRFIGSIKFIPILLRRERHARHDPLVVTPNPRLKALAYKRLVNTFFAGTHVPGKGADDYRRRTGPEAV